MLFVNSITDHHSRLLYIMGATWHTKCMFDLDSQDASFACLLNQQGVETYAVDIFGSGPGIKPDVIGNCYNDTVDYLSYLVEQYNIDNVMGYSTGCAFAAELTKKHKFKKIIFLDPRAKVVLDRKILNNDKYIITKQAVLKSLIDNQTEIDKNTTKDYIDALCQDDQLITAAYPITGQYLKIFDDKEYVDNLLNTNNTKTFFTKQSVEHTRELFAQNSVYWPHASHWILLEPYKKDLAQEVVQFLKHE